MNFSERLLTALLEGLAAYLPTGHDAAMRIMAQLLQQNLVDFPAISDQVLLRSLRRTSSHLPIWQLFDAEATRRALPIGPVQLNQLMLSPRSDAQLEDLLELARPNSIEWRGIVYSTLVEENTAGVFEDVRDYLSRRELVDPDNPAFTRGMVWNLISDAFRHYLNIPTGTWDFRGYLFWRVRWSTRVEGRSFPTSFPDGQPLWFGNLHFTERRIVNAALNRLVDVRRDIFFLHLYGGLTPLQHTTVAWGRPRANGQQAVVDNLEESWSRILS